MIVGRRADGDRRYADHFRFGGRRLDAGLRMIAPAATLCGVLARWQVKAAKRG
ncbi:hypothetical protein KIF59_14390 [Enterobacter cloacae subsp. cloacae]|nr:hypothetical protein [Enterobacter cloacae subsp. cloacae]